MALRAGFGRGVVTPPLPVFLAGFGARTDPATDVRDDLEARALYLADDEGAVCLVVCDLLGMSPRYASAIRDAVGAALGLTRDRVLTACTHTHQGPSVMAGGEALGWPTPEGYGPTLVDGCVAAAMTALAVASPAELHYARAPLPDDLSINRRGLPYDPSFAVLDVLAVGGGRIGALANVSIHPVALGPECLAVSSDWVGPFRRALEADTGSAAMLLSGALGDVNPHHVHRQDNECEEDGFAEADALGAGVAAAVSSALAATAPAGEGVTVKRWTTFEAPVGQTLLTTMGGMGPTAEVELLEWSIGGVEVVSVPGEAFHAFGRAVEENRGGRPMLLAGLAPVWQGYLPVPWGDGYEEGVSYGAAFVDAVLGAITAP